MVPRPRDLRLLALLILLIIIFLSIFVLALHPYSIVQYHVYGFSMIVHDKLHTRSITLWWYVCWVYRIVLDCSTLSVSRLAWNRPRFAILQARHTGKTSLAGPLPWHQWAFVAFGSMAVIWSLLPISIPFTKCNKPIGKIFRRGKSFQSPLCWRRMKTPQCSLQCNP